MSGDLSGCGSRVSLGLGLGAAASLGLLYLAYSKGWGKRTCRNKLGVFTCSQVNPRKPVVRSQAAPNADKTQVAKDCSSLAELKRQQLEIWEQLDVILQCVRELKGEVVQLRECLNGMTDQIVGDVRSSLEQCQKTSRKKKLGFSRERSNSAESNSIYFAASTGNKSSAETESEGGYTTANAESDNDHEEAADQKEPVLSSLPPETLDEFTQLLRTADKLHDGTDEDKAKGFKLLLANKPKYCSKPDFCWRLSRAYCDMLEISKDEIEKKSFLVSESPRYLPSIDTQPMDHWHCIPTTSTGKEILFKEAANIDRENLSFLKQEYSRHVRGSSASGFRNSVPYTWIFVSSLSVLWRGVRQKKKQLVLLPVLFVVLLAVVLLLLLPFIRSARYSYICSHAMMKAGSREVQLKGKRRRKLAFSKMIQMQSATSGPGATYMEHADINLSPIRYAILSGRQADNETIQNRIKAGFTFKEHIDKAIELKQNDPSLHYLLGRWCYEVAQLGWIERKAASTFYGTPPSSTIDEALKNFLRAEELRPGYSKDNSVYIAKCYRDLGSYATALHWLELASVLPIRSKEDSDAQIELEEMQTALSQSS
ncbi:regulator of microtubule dynamics protein 3 isoform X1 [Carcharodon carcharias]|uniref:regulator of microtubule dynamics protein 3 isoform X1 n=1 Tax=Carcharodon carcharias TaxID=13397 RepID=UPI001B7DB99B|nr:regulator of microtubule dynamics protein 3 isoform X1 [Carcharodon carcharias]XP_041069960.1 regulator of microtubule dynamics protein 3 isoform X1 [Carcharodon carcharias]